jgi:hypothetical protein
LALEAADELRLGVFETMVGPEPGVLSILVSMVSVLRKREGKWID